MILLTIPSPDPLPLPAPAWLLAALLLLTFFLHLVPMNLLLGGSIVGAVARLRGRSADATKLAAAITRALPTLIAATVTFGVAPLLFVQTLYGRVFFPSAILMAWLWLAVIPLVMTAYYGAYAMAFREKAGKGVAAMGIGIALIFLSIAFIYSNNMSLMLQPERFLPFYTADARGIHLDVGDVALFPRYLHMLLGAIAIAGLGVAIYGRWCEKTDHEHGVWAMRFGALWFSGATALNVVVGFWWLLALPREVMVRFMARSATATGSIAIGAVAGIVALLLGAMASRAAEPRPLVMPAVVSTVLTLIAMIIARDEVRKAMLEAAGFRSASWVEPQWGVIAVFAVLLVAAFATTIWMIAIVVRRPAGA